MRTYRIVEDGTEWESRPQAFDSDEQAREACEEMGWSVRKIEAGVIYVREYDHGKE